MPPKNHKSGVAKYNVVSTRVDDLTIRELKKRLGRKSIAKYLAELIEQDLGI